MDRKEEREAIIEQYLATPEGRKAVCDMLLDPIRKSYLMTDSVNAAIMGHINDVAYGETYYYNIDSEEPIDIPDTAKRITTIDKDDNVLWIHDIRHEGNTVHMTKIFDINKLSELHLYAYGHKLAIIPRENISRIKLDRNAENG